MDALKNDWITEGIIDFEYKKYQLLAYLKSVKTKFTDKKLYPQLAELVMHFNNLMTIKQQKTLIFEHFPRKISKVDFEKLKLSYEKIIQDDELMMEIYDVVNYAIPKFKKTIETGREIYDYVEHNLEIEVVGVMPMYDMEGYMFLAEKVNKDVNVYRYQVSIYQNANEKYRGINTTHVTTETRSISNTFENMKLKLIQNNTDLPNPATYLLLSNHKFPLSETLLPVAKRVLIKNIRVTA